MKILFLTSGSVKSNFTSRIVQLSTSLKKMDNDITLISPIADKYNNFVPEKIEEINGVRIIQPFQFNTKKIELNLIPYILHVIFILLTNKYDLVYIYKPTPITVIGLISKFIFRTKIVLDMDDVGSEVMRIEGHPIYQIKLVEWCENICSKYADMIVTASTFLENRYRNIYTNKLIITVSNGVDSSWFNELNYSNTKHKVVFMGSINRINILEPLFLVLPNLIKKYPELKVLIIGDGKYLQYFKDLSSNNNLNNNVEFLGWLNINDAKKLLLAGDIGYNFMPDELTTKSASNMKVMQYMARGVLPIVTNIGDLPGYVDGGNSGYICNPSVDNLESVLDSALSDDNRLNKAILVQKSSINKFDWDKLAEKVFNFSKAIVNNQIDKTTSKKNAYYLTINLPGNVGGGEIRNYHLLSSIANNSNFLTKIFCISVNDLKKDKQYIESLLPLKSYMVKNSNRTFFRILKSILIDKIPPYMNDFKASGLGELFYKECRKNLPYVIQLQQVHAYYVIRKYIPWLKKNGVKIILDCHNIEYKLLEDTVKILPFYKRFIGNFLVNRLKKIEREAVINSDLVLSCSQIDADYFKKINRNTVIIPNGVDLNYFSINPNTDDHSIIFIGGVGYPPNADAVKYYVNEIHPIIKKVFPDLKVYLIGTEKGWLNSSDQSLIPLGFVDDVRVYLNKSKIAISPLRYGSGTRLKILTYMASSLPVVSTSKGAEGVNYINNKDIIIEDNPKEFANIIINLFNNKDLRNKLSINGKKFVSDNFDWNVIGEQLNKYYENI